jgi:hypothetical protein
VRLRVSPEVLMKRLFLYREKNSLMQHDTLSEPCPSQENTFVGSEDGNEVIFVTIVQKRSVE